MLCLQYGRIGDWVYQEVFSSVDSAKEYVDPEALDVRWEAFDTGQWSSQWFGDPKSPRYRWVILGEELK